MLSLDCFLNANWTSEELLMKDNPKFDKQTQQLFQSELTSDFYLKKYDAQRFATLNLRGICNVH